MGIEVTKFSVAQAEELKAMILQQMRESNNESDYMSNCVSES